MNIALTNLVMEIYSQSIMISNLTFHAEGRLARKQIVNGRIQHQTKKKSWLKNISKLIFVKENTLKNKNVTVH